MGRWESGCARQRPQIIFCGWGRVKLQIDSCGAARVAVNGRSDLQGCQCV
jgi:hypothetical protein